MRLTEETIRSITFGAIRIKKEADGMHFYKCTQKQIDAWYALNLELGERASGTTGVRLDFHTDSPWLILDTAKGNKFEVLVNDQQIARLEFNELRAAGTTPKVELGEGEKRVTIVFPSHDDGGVLKGLELADGSTLTPHQHQRKILFIGDSITQGWNSYFDSNSFAYQVTRQLDADSVINGIGGAYYHESVFDQIDFEPDTVIIAYGTNDYGHYKTKEDLQYQASAFLDQIAQNYPAEKVYCILPIHRLDLEKVRSMGTFEECRTLLKEEITRRNFHVIDGFDLVPNHEFYFADAVHPNDIGFAEYAKNLLKEIK